MKKRNKQLREITEQDQDQLIAGLAEGFVSELEQKVQNQKEEAIQERLDSTLENDLGFTDEALAKTAALFNEAVKNKDSQLRAGIASLIGHYAPLLEGSDVIDVLGDRIEQLEAAIEYYEGENQVLASDVKERMSENYKLDETTFTSLWNTSADFGDLERKCQQVIKSDRPVKRSFVADQLEEINEDDSFANIPEHVPANMAPYLRFLK